MELYCLDCFDPRNDAKRVYNGLLRTSQRREAGPGAKPCNERRIVSLSLRVLRRFAFASLRVIARRDDEANQGIGQKHSHSVWIASILAMTQSDNS